jgi:hypothetical protein
MTCVVNNIFLLNQITFNLFLPTAHSNQRTGTDTSEQIKELVHTPLNKSPLDSLEWR